MFFFMRAHKAIRISHLESEIDSFSIVKASGKVSDNQIASGMHIYFNKGVEKCQQQYAASEF
jgi:hypothetical protein